MASNIDRLQVVRACSESWDEMQGDDRARYCRKCEKHVVNLSSLTRPEIEALIERTDGRFCSRLVRMPDGRVETAARPDSYRMRAVRWISGLAFAASTALAADGGTVRVRAVDPAGSVIVGAKVVLIDADRQPAATAVTDESGEASVRDLAEGDYRVEVVSTGFATFRSGTIRVQKNAIQALVAELNVGTVGETVMVESVQVEPVRIEPRGLESLSQAQPAKKRRRRFGWFR